MDSKTDNLNQGKTQIFLHDLNLVMSVYEVNKLYAVSKSTVRRWCECGVLIATKLDGCREWTISTKSVLDVLGYPHKITSVDT